MACNAQPDRTVLHCLERLSTAQTAAQKSELLIHQGAPSLVIGQVRLPVDQ